MAWHHGWLPEKFQVSPADSSPVHLVGSQRITRITRMKNSYIRVIRVIRGPFSLPVVTCLLPPDGGGWLNPAPVLPPTRKPFHTPVRSHENPIHPPCPRHAHRLLS